MMATEEENDNEKRKNAVRKKMVAGMMMDPLPAISILGATSSPPLPSTALPRRLPVYVMTSNVYERRRRDLSPFYRHQSGVSFFPGTASLRSAA